MEVEVEGRRRGGWLRWVEIEMNVASLQSFLVLGGGLICAAIDIHYGVDVKNVNSRNRSRPALW